MHLSKSPSVPAAGGRQDRLPLLLAFLLPVIIMIGILAGKSIYPFGDNSFLRTDMYHQYAPFFEKFLETIKSGGSLTYSFEIGLGSNFVALYAYYLASPLNWLLVLCPSSLVIEFMTYSIVLKIGLCGLTMGVYLRSKYRSDSLMVAFFGVCYALSGYIAAYSWNIMWLDCLWLAPLIILGLERLVRENRPFLYCIALGLSILSNYYISIMICIFMVLYFICEMIQLPGQKIAEYLKKTGLFALFSLIAGGLAAVLLIPAAMALMTTASADSIFPSTLTSYFSMVEMLARQMVNVDVEIGLDHWPNIYCGVACLLLFPAYIMNGKIPFKEKIVKSTLLVVMLLSFSFNIPNYIWHGMHYPNSLPCRQSFLYTIVLLAMCFEGLRGLKELTKGQIVACFWIDAAFILFCQVAVDVEDFDYSCFYLSLLFVGVYALLMYLRKIGRISQILAAGIALSLVIAETGMNMAVTSVTTTSRSEYWKNTENYQILLEQAEATEDGFFRVEKVSRRTKNDGAWVGYSSASLFSSTTQASISDFYKTFGLEGNTNAYSFTGATPLMASLLSVRYRLSTVELDDSALYEYAGWQDTTYLYRNLYTQSLGFMIPSDVSDYFTYYSGDPADAQNSFVSLTTGSGTVLEEAASNYDGTDTFTFTVEQSGTYYVYVDNSDVEDVTAQIGGRSDSFENVDRGYLLDLGTCEAGDVVTLTAGDGLELDATAYRFDDEVFIDWAQRISAQSMEITSMTNSLTKTQITASVTASEDGMLFTSIPYDTGWSVKVDGQEVETTNFAETFLALNLTAGTHTIEMEYHTPGLTAGILISLVSLLLLILLFFAWRPLCRFIRRQQIRRAAMERAAIRKIINAPDDVAAGTAPQAERTEPTAPEEDPEPEAPDKELTDDEIEEILLEDEDFLDVPLGDEQKNE